MTKAVKMETGSQQVRFGAMAVRRGLVTTEQVVKALALQVIEDLSRIKRRPIGDILLGQGIINDSQLNLLLTEMEKSKRMAQDAAIAG